MSSIALYIFLGLLAAHLEERSDPAEEGITILFSRHNIIVVVDVVVVTVWTIHEMIKCNKWMRPHCSNPGCILDPFSDAVLLCEFLRVARSAEMR